MVVGLTDKNCLLYVATSEPNVYLEPREVFKVGQQVSCKILGMHKKSNRLLGVVNLAAEVERYQIESSGTREWKFFDKNLTCFTDIKKGICLDVQVVTKTQTRIQVNLGPNVPMKGILVKTRQTEGLFNDIMVGSTIKLEIASNPTSINLKFIRLCFPRQGSKQSKSKKTGDLFTCKVEKFSLNGLEIICQGETGFIPVLEISNDFTELKGFIKFVKEKKKFHPKYAKGRTLEVVKLGSRIYSLKRAQREYEKKVKNTDLFKPGSTTIGIVGTITKEGHVSVDLPNSCKGIIHITNIADKYTNQPGDKYNNGDIIQTYVVGPCENRKNFYDLSIRHLKNPKVSVIKVENLKKGDKIQGYIKAVV
eukprot:UN33380